MARNGDSKLVRSVLDALRLDNVRRRRSSRRLVRDAYGKEPCVYCGGGAGTADHVMPRKLGGGHLLGNMVPACRKCNGKKGADPPADFFAKYPKAAKRFLERAIYADEELRDAARKSAVYLIAPQHPWGVFMDFLVPKKPLWQTY